MSGKKLKRNAGIKKRRVKNRKKKAIILIVTEIILILAIVLMLGWNHGIGSGVSGWINNITKPVVRELDLSGINSSNALLMQVKGGKVIGEINGDAQMYPASMTKIMTAIVSIEELDDLEQEITLSSEMFAGLYEQDATQAGFQPNENVHAIDLLYGAMLPSGAECCIALADTVSGSEEAFVEKMNKKAEKIGMTNSHFCDTTGLHDPDHYSTCRDMAVLLRYALKNDTFREIIESPWHSTPATNIHPDGITFYSTIFKNLSSTEVTDGTILGGKTGFTNAAGFCLASFASIEGTEYILVTSGAMQAGTPHINDAVTIYNRLGEATLALNSET